ncbi:hypothetical protein EMCRGX_G023150 [Ephydatia muelleri]
MCADENEDLVEKACLYLFDGRYPEGSTSNDKRVIRRKAATLTLRDGEVFYKKPKKNSTGQKEVFEVRYVRSSEERCSILKACHVDITSGHMGVKRTSHRVLERFFWKGVTKDIEIMISTCDLCQRNSQKLSISTPELFPVPVHSPWHHVGIDFVGPISPKTTSGNSYILTLCDYFTKWVEAVALPTKEASGIASSLFKIFMKMGLPAVITTDQGSEFKNQLNDEMMKILNIKHHLITAYHPQSNGLVERFNQSLQNMLRKYIQEKKEKWDDYLDTCTFAYNTSRHESTKFTPFEIMFGRKAILPLDLDASVHQGPCNEAEVTICSQETEIQQKESQHKALLEEVQKNIISAQKKQKEQYDKKHSKAVFYSAGTHVLKKDFRKKKKKKLGGKLDFPWVGPYLITRSLGKELAMFILKCKVIVCSPSRRLQSPSASNESHSSPSPPVGPASTSRSAVSLSPTMDETTLALSPTAKDSASAVLQERPTSTSRSAVSLSPTMDETTVALSPTAKDSASAVLQESNHTSELETSSLLSEKPKLLIPTPEFFPRGDGTRSKRECNTKTKRVAKLMRQNSKKMTVPCQPAVEVESYVPLAQDEVQHWVPGLTTEDKKMITSGGWLSDEIVDAGQKLLKSMYPHIQGLQEVALGMVLSYSIAKSEFIQIMNTGKHHWVTVSNINCNDEEIHVYDCASGSPTSSLLNQIASIVCTPKDIIKLTYVDVQMQQGCDDCGLFAIAFATSLARGEQPGSFFYQQKAMRKHLVDCLEKQNITAFPIQKIRRHGSKDAMVGALKQKKQFHAMLEIMGVVFLMQKWIAAANQLSCQADGVEVTCPPRVCPNSQVVFSCTVSYATGSNLWKLPTNSCYSGSSQDTITLTQTAGVCSGVTQQCGPFTAQNVASGSNPCLKSLLSVVATMAISTIACGSTDINGIQTIINRSSINIIDIPEHVDNIVVTTAVSKSTNIAEYIVTVVWTPSTMGGPPTSYNISINGSYPVAIPANGSNGSATYMYIGLQSDTVYKVSIMAFNCAGASTPAISMIRTWAGPPKNIFAVVWGEVLTFQWSPVGGSVLNYSIVVSSNGALIRDDVVPCISSLCSYSLVVQNISNTTYFTAGLASVNGDNAVGTRSSYTIG